jgi:hypothetical protein
MVKYFINQWQSVEKPQAMELIRTMTNDLAQYAERENAVAYAVKKRKEIIKQLAKFIDNTDRIMEAISSNIQTEFDDQFSKGMRYQKRIDFKGLDKYGVDKEFVRLQSIIYNQKHDNV